MNMRKATAHLCALHPLLRCSFLSNYGAQITRNGRIASRIEDLATWDAELTHRSRTCIDANHAFIAGLYYVLQGYEPARIKEMTLDFCKRAFIVPSVIQAVSGELPVLGHGWVLYALQHAFTFGLRTGSSFEEIMGEVTKLGYDTDTNCAVVGAMLGARSIIPNGMNYNTIYYCRPKTRPQKYWASSIMKYANGLQKLIYLAQLMNDVRANDQQLKAEGV